MTLRPLPVFPRKTTGGFEARFNFSIAWAAEAVAVGADREGADETEGATEDKVDICKVSLLEP